MDTLNMKRTAGALIVIGILIILGVGSWYYSILFEENDLQWETFEIATGILDANIRLKYPADWTVDYQVGDELFIKLLPPEQNNLNDLTYLDTLYSYYGNIIDDLPVYLKVSIPDGISEPVPSKFSESVYRQYCRDRSGNTETNSQVPSYYIMKDSEYLIEFWDEELPGKHFVACQNSILLQIYRPGRMVEGTIFKEITENIILTGLPKQKYSESDGENFNVIFYDNNTNWWLWNILENKTKKIDITTNNSHASAWLFESQRLITTSSGYSDGKRYSYTDLLTDDVVNLNKIFSVRGVHEMSLLPTGEIIWRNKERTRELSPLNSMPLYITDQTWGQFDFLLQDSESAGTMAWSPDGSMAVFESGYEYGSKSPTLTLYDSQTKLYTEIVSGKEASWISNNQFVYIGGYDEEYKVFQYDTNTRSHTLLLSESVQEYIVSKDGEYITFVVNPYGDNAPFKLVVYNISTGESQDFNMSDNVSGISLKDGGYKGEVILRLYRGNGAELVLFDGEEIISFPYKANSAVFGTKDIVLPLNLDIE